MTLRPARPADIADLHRLERLVFGDDAWSEQSVRSELAGAGSVAWVAEADGVVVGYAMARSGDVVDLMRIAVHPAHRRRGVARELLAGVLVDPVARVLLEVGATNEAALALYAATGFVEIDRRPRYYRDGTDAVVLARAREDGRHEQ